MSVQDLEEATTENEIQDLKKKKNPFRLEKEKEDREKRQKKRARIIVRNISYKATDESLNKHFAQFGKIEDLNLLKRPDGKLVGCAFIQYEKVNEAAKAILKCTNKEFLGRPVYVDWALGKNEYERNKPEKEVKEEKDTEIKEEETEIKEEEADEVKELDEESENDSDDEEDSDEDDDEKDSESDSDEENSDEEDVIKEEDEDKKDVKAKVGNIKKEKVESHDVTEGCTVFIKNVPFDASEQDLRKVCRKFGPLYYAVITKDHVSGYSKGTGFAKFKTRESAELCLRSGEEFVLNDTVLEPHPAMSRDEVKDMSDKKSKKDDGKDSRNLYLAKEGIIMTNSKAAEGVSPSDMKKRHGLERVKTQVLKNLNRFVSRNRLSIHNLPIQYDNEKLKDMIIKHTGFRPHECRVMRDNKPTADFPQGMSKGFGFVSFNTHLDALTGLRKLNNNPTIFGNTNRPIVAFSIEDRSVHNIKQKRLEKSKSSNPNYQEKLANKKARRKERAAARNQVKDNKTEVQKQIKKLEESRNKKANPKKKTANVDASYVGEEAKPGSFIKMRSMKKIRAQAQEHKQKAGEVKKMEKVKRDKKALKAERKQKDYIKPKEKIEKDTVAFTNMVSKYKRMLDRQDEPSQPKVKRKKWYKD